MKTFKLIFSAYLILTFLACNNNDNSPEIENQEYITYQINDESPKIFTENLGAILYPIDPFYDYEAPILLIGADIEFHPDCFYLRGALNTAPYSGVYNSTANYGYEPGFIISDCFGNNIMTPWGNDIIFNITSIGNIGEFIDVNFSGTFTNFDDEESYISGTIHVRRDPHE